MAHNVGSRYHFDYNIIIPDGRAGVIISICRHTQQNIFWVLGLKFIPTHRCTCSHERVNACTCTRVLYRLLACARPPALSHPRTKKARISPIMRAHQNLLPKIHNNPETCTSNLLQLKILISVHKA